jgi:hypothetical protein
LAASIYAVAGYSPTLFFTAAKPPKQPADFRSDPLELFAVGGSNLLQHGFAAAGELNEDPAAIPGAWHTNGQVPRYQPVNQSNRKGSSTFSVE